MTDGNALKLKVGGEWLTGTLCRTGVMALIADDYRDPWDGPELEATPPDLVSEVPVIGWAIDSEGQLLLPILPPGWEDKAPPHALCDVATGRCWSSDGNAWATKAACIQDLRANADYVFKRRCERERAQAQDQGGDAMTADNEMHDQIAQQLFVQSMGRSSGDLDAGLVRLLARRAFVNAKHFMAERRACWHAEDQAANAMTDQIRAAQNHA